MPEVGESNERRKKERETLATATMGGGHKSGLKMAS